MRPAPRAFVLLSVLIVLALVPPTTGQTFPVTVSAEPRVRSEAVSDFTRAADLTVHFFRETYGLELSRSIRILLVPDAAAYADTMMREWNITQGEAGRRVQTTSGWTSGTTIIVNTANTSTPRARIFLAAHELTHQYQIQASAPTGAWTLYWLTEGAADVVGARLVDRGGAGAMADTRQAWVTALRRAATRPDLDAIATESAWFAALNMHGAAVTYRYAGMAALYLAETKGYPPLMGFFAALRESRERAPAFQRAAGITLDEFTHQFKLHLERLLQ